MLDNSTVMDGMHSECSESQGKSAGVILVLMVTINCKCSIYADDVFRINLANVMKQIIVFYFK